MVVSFKNVLSYNLANVILIAKFVVQESLPMSLWDLEKTAVHN